MYIVTNYGIPCFVASSKAKAIEYIEAGIDHEIGYDPEEWGLFPYQMDTEISYDSMIMYSDLSIINEDKENVL